MSDSKSREGGEDSPWGSSSEEDVEEEKKKIVAEKWKSVWGSSGNEEETPEGHKRNAAENSVKGDGMKSVVAGETVEIETGRYKVANKVSEHGRMVTDDIEVTGDKQKGANKESEVDKSVDNTEKDVIGTAEMALRDAQTVLEFGKSGGWTTTMDSDQKNKSETGDDSKVSTAGEAGVVRKGSLHTVDEEDERSKWSDSEVEDVPGIKTKDASALRLPDATAANDLGTESESNLDGKNVIDWSSSDEELSKKPNTKPKDPNKLQNDLATAAKTKSIEDGGKPSHTEDSAGSSSESEDLEGPKHVMQQEKNTITSSLETCNETAVSAEVIRKPRKSKSWTATPSPAKQSTNSPREIKSSSDNGEVIENASLNDTNQNVDPKPKYVSPSRDMYVVQSDENIGDIRNEVRLARVTSSEIFGEMELEFEINPFAKGANSVGQGDSTFVDPFKVKTETQQPISVDGHRGNNNDPIPYSILLGIKTSSKSTNEKKTVKTKGQDRSKSKIDKRSVTSEDDTFGEAMSSSSSSEIKPAAESAPTFKKPLFSRLKRKLSKTFLKSNSSLQVTQSLPTLNEERPTDDVPNSKETVKSQNIKSASITDDEEGSIHDLMMIGSQISFEENQSTVPQGIVQEHRALQLLREAKDFAENILSPEDKKEVENLLQSISEKDSADDLLLDVDSNVKDTSTESDLEAELSILSHPGPVQSSYSRASYPPNTARSNVPRPMPVAVSIPRYCDTMDPCHPDPNAVSQLLNELGCIYSKILGRNCGSTQECRELQDKFRALQQRLADCERCKAHLEMEITKLQNELKAMLRALDEECQRRCNLEQLVAQLKSQLECLEQELCALRGERDQLFVLVEDLKCQLRNAMNDIQRLTREEIALEGRVRERDEEIIRLKDALEKCCKRVDELMEENSKLRADICRLERELEAVTKERNSLAALLDCERKAWAEERCLLEEINCKLKNQVACLEQEKDEICRKFRESTELHHDELDCIRLEKERFECLYEEERKARESLEKKLRDCEEQKRLNQEQAMLVSNSQCATRERNSPCDKFRFDIERLEQERTELQNARRCLDLEQQLANAQMERSVLMRQIDGFKYQEQQQAQNTTGSQCKRVHFSATSQGHAASVNEQETQTIERNEDHEKVIIALKEQFDQALEHQLANAQMERSVLLRQIDEFKSNEHQQAQNTSRSLSKQVRCSATSQTDAASVNEQETQTIERIEDHEKEIIALKEQVCLDLEQQLADAQLERSVLMRQIDEFNMNKQQQVQNNTSGSQCKQARFNATLQGHAASVNEQYTQTDSSQSNEEQEKEINVLKKQLITLSVQTEALEKEVAREKGILEQATELTMKERLERLKRKLKQEYDDKLAVEKKKIQFDTHAKSKAEIAELTTTNKTIKHETKKLKKMVNERDERIGALESVVSEVKRKYAEQHKQIRIQKIQMEALKSDIEKLEAQNLSEQSQLEQHRRLLLGKKSELEAEWTKLKNSKKDFEKEKASLKNLKTMKDRIESDVIKVQDAISNRMVDRSELESLRKSYEDKLIAMKSQFDAQLEMNRQLAEINEYLGRQAQDRSLVEKIRDSNESVLRKELNSVSAAMRLDSEKLTTLIKERDEEISSLRKSVGLLKEKYAKEAQQREELVKKVHILSSLSQESLQTSPSTNNNNFVLPNYLSHQLP